MEINAYQRKVLDNYSNGDHSHILTKEELDDCGDGLLRFLMSELSASEDCDSIETARQRVETAIKDLEPLLRELEDMED